MEIIFATNNKHKLEEVQYILGDRFNLTTPKENGIFEEIPEQQATIAGNASQKSHYIFEKVHKNCFSDDTGLEVEALGGEPGVYSARYAGEQCSFVDNINKLLQKMEGVKNRRARFVTVISLIIDGKEELFEGVVEGEILEQARGEGGFGYDAIFQAEGYSESFAQMSPQQKNAISHRARATQKLAEFLKHK